jgi:pSer/pThr/pTyr-binding forkhead associated (FHA) protein
MNVNLVLFKKNGLTRTFPLPDDVTVIGRRQECDLCIPLTVISRRHCELSRDQDVLRVRDLGSKNGTYVNGQKVPEASLKPGDTLRIGPVSFGIQIDNEPAEFAFNDSAVLSPPAPVHSTDPEDSDLFAELDAIDTMHNDDLPGPLDDLIDEDLDAQAL